MITSTTTKRKPLAESKRTRIAHALETLGLLDRLLWLRGKLRTPVITALTYHRVADAAQIGELDPEVAETDAAGFAEQIAVIKQNSTIVSLSEVRLFLRGKRLPPNPVLIGFDDGYADCHDVALPILQKAGVTGTFFVPTAYPGSGRLFAWDRIRMIIGRSKAESIKLSYPVPLHLELRKDPEEAKRRLLWFVKRTPGIDIDRLWEELEGATGVHIDPDEERDLASRTIMGWDKVRRLHDAGMSVQSHSHTHRVLSTMTPDEARRDLQLSRKILSEVLEHDVRTVAYPVGHRLSPPFMRAVRDAGFDLGFLNNAGLCVVPRVDPLNVPRIAVDRDHVGALYRLLLLVGTRPHPLTVA
ncbi:polysaccharide deacetylase family protein [Polyangium aurulentum]|uniref:polysaccharide deacetylase family protein n=1 Tax=Polyangium aurulentum TaxID=2567896 RepID=UPI0010ADEFFA|nr:polysaccharide deacetylase family protein [Polyangium aurulentum]UQA55501.1 polysaccharide deacetylase family protein [Polyangium aurulentum]